MTIIKAGLLLRMPSRDTEMAVPSNEGRECDHNICLMVWPHGHIVRFFVPGLGAAIKSSARLFLFNDG